MYHFFFIHTSVDEHLGCFCILTTVNSAAIHIVLHVSFWIMIFSSMLFDFSSMFASFYGSCYRKYIIKIFIAIVENVIFFFPTPQLGKLKLQKRIYYRRESTESILIDLLSIRFKKQNTCQIFYGNQINGNIEFTL